MRSKISNAIVGLITAFRPRRTPAVEANEQLTAHAAYLTCFVLMPVALASSKLSAVARMDFPRFVYFNRTWVDTTKAIPTDSVAICRVGWRPSPGTIGMS